MRGEGNKKTNEQYKQEVKIDHTQMATDVKNSREKKESIPFRLSTCSEISVCTVFATKSLLVGSAGNRKVIENLQINGFTWLPCC